MFQIVKHQVDSGEVMRDEAEKVCWGHTFEGLESLLSSQLSVGGPGDMICFMF